MKSFLLNPLGAIILSKINGLDIVQDTEIQYLDVAKQNNIHVKYSKKLFKSFRSYKFIEL